ncbi:Hypothetical protein, putative [Bodo saltans]|uniref:Bodo-specific multi-copy gene family n=1 Tax=Bodo saltans TaxID=75058 RepID=A0A0S4J8X6_BODSA|nr:Hypothetical protein, putative [Bodo saltans]|eukprot:CUG86565.1 Hypothetical protein, putative [Bodo saltans]
MIRLCFQSTLTPSLVATLFAAQRLCSSGPASQMPSPNSVALPVSAHVHYAVLPLVQRDVEMYEKWAAETGACSLHDLTQGAKQAYTALGVTLDQLVRASKPDLAKQLAPFPRARLLSYWFPAKARIFNAVASMTRKAIFGTSVSNPMLDTLPLDSEFKSRLAVTLKAGGKGRRNVFQIAHPNDYVVDAQLLCFDKFFDVPSMEPCRPFRALPIAILLLTDLYVGAFIPSTAKASVTVQVLVVTPPRRFNAGFDWFYDRITECETENERIAIANVMALLCPSQFATRVLDSFDRFEFAAPLVPSAMGVPPATKDKILVKKKIMRLYLSKDNEWTIADVVNLEDKYDFEVRQQ